MLDSLDIKLLLQEDEMKKEIEDWCVCVCEYCGAPETVDIHDSYRNTSPFICSLCYVTDVIQNCHNGGQMSSYTNHNNHFSYPNTDVWIKFAGRLLTINKCFELNTAFQQIINYASTTSLVSIYHLFSFDMFLAACHRRYWLSFKLQSGVIKFICLATSCPKRTDRI